jgi:ketosteroid isomerase-like protein
MLPGSRGRLRSPTQVQLPRPVRLVAAVVRQRRTTRFPCKATLPHCARRNSELVSRSSLVDVDRRNLPGDTERAMSEENVQLVREGYEAWNRGDLEWLLDHITPGYEFRTAQLLPDTEAVYRGPDGLRQFWNTFREPWETLLIEVERLEPIGDDQVLALLRFHGRGRDGIEVTLKYGNLLTIENGLASRNVGFADWQSALEAVGLRE